MKKRKPSKAELARRAAAKLLKKVRRQIASQGGKARWANVSPEARSEYARTIANVRHAKGKADAESTS